MTNSRIGKRRAQGLGLKARLLPRWELDLRGRPLSPRDRLAACRFPGRDHGRVHAIAQDVAHAPPQLARPRLDQPRRHLDRRLGDGGVERGLAELALDRRVSASSSFAGCPRAARRGCRAGCVAGELVVELGELLALDLLDVHLERRRLARSCSAGGRRGRRCRRSWSRPPSSRPAPRPSPRVAGPSRPRLARRAPLHRHARRRSCP